MNDQQASAGARGDVTRMLAESEPGDRHLLDRLLPLVYQELRALSADFMSRERPDHTLDPTALAHEAWLRLVDQTRVDWHGRAHFFAVAAQAIRRTLVDHARGRGRQKRGGGRRHVALVDRLVEAQDRAIDLLALDEALSALAAQSPQPARVVELRYFGGLSVDETATVLGVSVSSVERDWRYARAILRRALCAGGRGG